MVTENCLKNTPIGPERKATGTNTAPITKVMAKIAPEISCIASWVAAKTGMSFSSILAWTASTTTIALSTTIPIAKTKENNVNKLMENPKANINVNVPTSETGTAIIGTKVARQSCKKIKTTKATSKNASNKVLITS